MQSIDNEIRNFPHGCATWNAPCNPTIHSSIDMILSKQYGAESIEYRYETSNLHHIQMYDIVFVIYRHIDIDNIPYKQYIIASINKPMLIN